VKVGDLVRWKGSMYADVTHQQGIIVDGPRKGCVRATGDAYRVAWFTVSCDDDDDDGFGWHGDYYLEVLNESR